MDRKQIKHPTVEERPTLPIGDHYQDGRTLLPGIWEPVFTDRQKTPDEIDPETGSGTKRPDYYIWVCAAEGCGKPTETVRLDNFSGGRPHFILVTWCSVHGPVMPPPGLGVGVR